jgi:hypothetical protein
MTASGKWRGLFEELEPTPGRWRRAARVGLITALGAGATAAMQITNPLGLTLLFNFALPEAAFSPARGVAFVCFAAVFQVLGLVLVGALVDSPVVHVTVFILLCLFTTYAIYAVPTLGRLWVWIQVPVVTAFYLALFIPDGLLLNEAQAFGAMAIAVIVLLLCNSIVRPEPAESALANSIATTLTRSGLRLATLIEILLCEVPATDDRPVASRLGYHLSLLGPAITAARSAAWPATLLADVMVAEGIRGQTDRLAAAALASERPPPSATSVDELRALRAAINHRLERYVESLRAQRTGRAPSASSAMPGTPGALQDADDLAARIARLGTEAPELAAITAPMVRICELLEADRIELPSQQAEVPSEEVEIDEPARPRPAVARNFLIRFSTRHTIALTAAFLIGLWDNRPELHAAIWLLMLGGPPSHGATARKFTMRAFGASGALALAALGTVVIDPNFTSPGPYMGAIFAGTLLMAYIGEGGGILSYLSIGGTAFVIGYGGPGPRADVLGSIWSIWGISLGMIVRAVVSIMWRERASRTLAEQFQAPLTAMLDLMEGGDGPEGKRRRAAAEMATVAGIAMMLTVANDALLEGRGAEIDGDQLVNALDTLRRLAFAIGNLARLETAGSADSPLLADAIRGRLESWLQSLRDQTDSGVVSRAPLRKMVAEAKAPELHLLLGEVHSASPGIDTSYRAAAARVIRLTQKLEFQLATVSLN